jgi:hypothetical protein
MDPSILWGHYVSPYPSPHEVETFCPHTPLPMKKKESFMGTRNPYPSPHEKGGVIYGEKIESYP